MNNEDKAAFYALPRAFEKIVEEKYLLRYKSMFFLINLLFPS